MDSKELQAQISTYVSELAELMSVEAEIKCTVEPSDNGEQNVVNIEFEGERLGYMIGNSGRHLRSLQFILSMLINKKFVQEGEQSLYVNVDVSGYRKVKNDKVAQIALRMADDARILGEPVDMDPMPSVERRIVHTTLSQFDDIKTESYGEGRDRYVRIIPLSDEEIGIKSKGGEENEEEAEE